jgi:hypothetical protein
MISPTHRSPATGEPTPGCEGGKGAASGRSRAACGDSFDLFEEPGYPNDSLGREAAHDAAVIALGLGDEA